MNQVHPHDGGVAIVAITIFAIVFLVLYMLPWIVAKCRNHPNSAPIFFVNLFFGWSLIGWVGCIVWALINTQPQIVYLVDGRPEDPNYNPLTDPNYIKTIRNGG